MTATKKAPKKTKVAETIDAGGGILVDVVEPAKKHKNAKVAEAKARLLGAKNVTTVIVPLADQLTPEEEDALKGKKKGTKKKKPQNVPSEAPAPVKAAKGGNKPQNATDAKPEGKKGHVSGLPTSEQRPGIIATILRELCAASEKKPVTKQMIFDVLKKEFPHRSQSSMMSTINHQVPSYLKYAGHAIHKNDKGYWGVKDGGDRCGEYAKKKDK